VPADPVMYVLPLWPLGQSVAVMASHSGRQIDRSGQSGISSMSGGPVLADDCSCSAAAMSVPHMDASISCLQISR
jgi:hypothetical protein